jgi:hypothetical protein
MVPQHRQIQLAAGGSVSTGEPFEEPGACLVRPDGRVRPDAGAVGVVELAAARAGLTVLADQGGIVARAPAHHAASTPAALPCFRLPRVMPVPVLPRPYPQAALDSWTDEQWRLIPAVGVPVHDLVPTQEGVGLAEVARLANGGDPQGGDGLTGRAVRWRGRLYLHDGHTRWLIAVLRGWPVFWVRIVELAPDGSLIACPVLAVAPRSAAAAVVLADRQGEHRAR